MPAGSGEESGLCSARRRKAATSDPAMPPLGNPAPCAPRRMHPLFSHCRNSESGCRQILRAACRLERCGAAAARSDLQQSHRPARRRWMLAGLDQVRVIAANLAPILEARLFIRTKAQPRRALVASMRSTSPPITASANIVAEKMASNVRGQFRNDLSVR